MNDVFPIGATVYYDGLDSDVFADAGECEVVEQNMFGFPAGTGNTIVLFPAPSPSENPYTQEVANEYLELR